MKANAFEALGADSAAFEALGADSAALQAAALAAEDALCLQREALAVLNESWGGESGSAAVDLVQRQCIEGSGVVAELQRVAGELALLRDSLADGAGPGAWDAAARRGDASAAPAVQPAPPPAPAPWAPTGTALPAVPDFGGALAGFVAQIAELLGSGADPPVDEPPDVPAEPTVDATVQRQPVQSTAESPPVPVELPTVVPQQDSPPGAAVVTQPASDPEPLLAAELPAPAEPAADPAPDPATPCEIAADDLPQVGR